MNIVPTGTQRIPIGRHLILRGRIGESSSLALFHVDALTGFTELCQIDQNSHVRRSLTIGEFLYSIADNGVKVMAIGQLQTVVAEVTLPDALPANVDDVDLINWMPMDVIGFKVGDPTAKEPPTETIEETPLEKMLDVAIDMLEEQRGIDKSSVLVVATNAENWIDDSLLTATDAGEGIDGFEMTLESGGERFVVHTDQGDEAVLTAAYGVELASAADMFQQNPDNPTDVNDDGVESPLDILITINYLTDAASGALHTRAGRERWLATTPRDGEGEFNQPRFYLDVNGDGAVAPIDVLIVVNKRNQPPLPQFAIETPHAPIESAARIAIFANDDWSDSSVPIRDDDSRPFADIADPAIVDTMPVDEALVGNEEPLKSPKPIVDDAWESLDESLLSLLADDGGLAAL